MEEEVPESIIEAHKREKLTMSPRGAVAFLIKQPKGKTSDPSKIFCFLPLPQKFSFPDGVHISGHFALDYENRRELWKPTQYGSNQYIAWNEYLMKGVIGPLYVLMLSDRQVSIAASKPAEMHGKAVLNRDYFHLFPTCQMKHKDVYTNFLHDAIYRMVYTRSIPLFPVQKPENGGIEWQPIKATWSDNELYFDNLHQTEILKELIPFSLDPRKASETPPYEYVRSLLVESGFKILSLVPLTIYDSLTAVLGKECVKMVTPKAVLDFFMNHPMIIELPANIDETSFKSDKHLQWLLKYCKSEPCFTKCIEGLPFLLTRDGQLRVIDSSFPAYVTRFSKLVPESFHMFVHESMIEFFTHLVANEKEMTPGLVDFRIADLARIVSPPENENKGWVDLLWIYLVQQAKIILKPYISDSEQVLTQMLSPLEAWKIFPVKHLNNSVTLLPLRDTKSTLDLDLGNMDSSLKRIFVQLRLPVPHYTYFTNYMNDEIRQLMKKLVASIDRPDYIALCLSSQMEKGIDISLSSIQAKKLLQYFAMNLEHIKGLADAKTILRKMPYYSTWKGQLVSLERSMGYLIPHTSKMPTDDTDVWQGRGSHVIFLQSSSEPALNELLIFLGNKLKHEDDIYIDFILVHNNFSKMSLKGKINHIEYVRTTLLPNLQENGTAWRSIIQKLQVLECVPDRDGFFHRASEFFDPFSKVFRVMEPHGPFPWKEIHGWLTFLKKIGMTCEISEERFIRYAKRVEAIENINEIKHRQSKVLVEHFYQRQDYSEDFLHQIKSIGFIAPYDVCSLKNLHPQYSNEGYCNIGKALPFASFEGSVICTESTAKLCWTSTSIIQQKQGEDLTDKQCKQLGVIKAPTLRTVVSHLQNLTRSSVQYTVTNKRPRHENERKQLIDVLRMIYNHLLKNIPALTPFISELQLTECIPVEDGKHLVCPSQVVEHLMPNDEIAPYLYRLPDEMRPYKELFHLLGTSEEVTVKQYATVLQQIHGQCDGENMDPNEIESSLQAFIALMDITERLDNFPDHGINTLYILSRDRLLLPSSQLIFSNQTGLERRLIGLQENFVIDAANVSIDSQYFTKLSAFRLNNFFKKLPKVLRPMYLSDKVKEELDEEDDYDTANKPSTEMIEYILRRIQSDAFKDGLLRLLKDSSLCRMNTDGTHKFEQVLTDIEKVRISCTFF